MGACARLIFSKDGEVIKTHDVAGDALVGRAEECVIRLSDRAISRQHAVFRATSEGLQLEKKSEFAPLSVNGQECTRALLKEGDVIAIGPYLVQLSLTSASDAAHPHEHERASATDRTQVGGATQAELEGQPPVGGTPSTPEAGSAELAPPNLEADEFPHPQTDSFASHGAEAGTAGIDLAALTQTAVLPREKLAVKLVFAAGGANFPEVNLTKDRVSIGRAKDCEVVLDDKECSSHHAVIERHGSHFVLKDQNSQNGTYINGLRVAEKELEGDDAIRIGKTEFQFKAEHVDFAEQEAGLILLPQIEHDEHAHPAGRDPDPAAYAPPSLADGAPDLPPHDDSAAAVDPGAKEPPPEPARTGPFPGFAGIPGIPGIAGLGNAATSGNSLRALRARFNELPPLRKAIWVGAICVGLWTMLDLFDSSPASKHAKGKKKAPVAKEEKGTTYDMLPAEQQQYVRIQRQLAIEDMNKHEFDKALFEINKVFALVPNDPNSRQIENYAREGKHKADLAIEEKRRQEDEARAHARISQITDEIQEKIQARDFEGAKERLTEIISLDPENPSIPKWKAEIEQHEQATVIAEQKRRIQAEINERGRALIKRAGALMGQGKFYEALNVLRTVTALGASDPRVRGNAASLSARGREELAGVRTPVLNEAKQAEEGGEFAKAFQLFHRASQIDPGHPEPTRGMNRVRGALHERAKATYTEAVLAESYSDLSGAKKKFQEVLQTAPADDPYYERAQRKLAPYIKSGVPDEPGN